MIPLTPKIQLVEYLISHFNLADLSLEKAQNMPHPDRQRLKSRGSYRAGKGILMVLLRYLEIVSIIINRKAKMSLRQQASKIATFKV